MNRRGLVGLHGEGALQQRLDTIIQVLGGQSGPSFDGKEFRDARGQQIGPLGKEGCLSTCLDPVAKLMGSLLECSGTLVGRPVPEPPDHHFQALGALRG